MPKKKEPRKKYYVYDFESGKEVFESDDFNECCNYIKQNVSYSVFGRKNLKK